MQKKQREQFQLVYAWVALSWESKNLHSALPPVLCDWMAISPLWASVVYLVMWNDNIYLCKAGPALINIWGFFKSRFLSQLKLWAHLKFTSFQKKAPMLMMGRGRKKFQTKCLSGDRKAMYWRFTPYPTLWRHLHETGTKSTMTQPH